MFRETGDEGTIRRAPISSEARSRALDVGRSAMDAAQDALLSRARGPRGVVGQAVDPDRRGVGRARPRGRPAERRARPDPDRQPAPRPRQARDPGRHPGPPGRPRDLRVAGRDRASQDRPGRARAGRRAARRGDDRAPPPRVVRRPRLSARAARRPTSRSAPGSCRSSTPTRRWSPAGRTARRSRTRRRSPSSGARRASSSTPTSSRCSRPCSRTACRGTSTATPLGLDHDHGDDPGPSGLPAPVGPGRGLSESGPPDGARRPTRRVRRRTTAEIHDAVHDRRRRRADAPAPRRIAPVRPGAVDDPVQLRRHRRERPPAEDRLDRQAEVLGGPQGEVEARVVLAALEVADRLVVHAQRVGELLAREPALGAQDREPVVEDRLDAIRRARHHASSAMGSGSIQASAAVGRTGRSTAFESTSAFARLASIVTGCAEQPDLERGPGDGEDHDRRAGPGSSGSRPGRGGVAGARPARPGQVRPAADVGIQDERAADRRAEQHERDRAPEDVAHARREPVASTRRTRRACRAASRPR